MNVLLVTAISVALRRTTTQPKTLAATTKGNAHPSQARRKKPAVPVFTALAGKGTRPHPPAARTAGDQSMPHHDDPVQPGLDYGFARDEMIFG